MEQQQTTDKEITRNRMADGKQERSVNDDDGADIFERNERKRESFHATASAHISS